jgi:hypothetical protein
MEASPGPLNRPFVVVLPQISSKSWTISAPNIADRFAPPLPTHLFFHCLASGLRPGVRKG